MPAPQRLVAVLLFLVVSISSAIAQDGDRKIRNVTPDNIPVIILPPRPEPEKNPKSLLESPISGDTLTAILSDDGRITANGRTLLLFGIRPIPSSVLCETENGSRWACGLRAFVTLRNLLHMKEIICETVRERGAVAISRCFRDRRNISEWLIADGWAIYDDSASDETLATAAQDAQKNARGIWQNGSRILPNR